jgi:hypothetical protein
VQKALETPGSLFIKLYCRDSSVFQHPAARTTSLTISRTNDCCQSGQRTRNVRTPLSTIVHFTTRLQLEAKANSLGLPTHVVADAGRTEVARGSRTVLAMLGKLYDSPLCY